MSICYIFNIDIHIYIYIYLVREQTLISTHQYPTHHSTPTHNDQSRLAQVTICQQRDGSLLRKNYHYPFENLPIQQQQVVVPHVHLLKRQPTIHGRLPLHGQERDRNCQVDQPKKTKTPFPPSDHLPTTVDMVHVLLTPSISDLPSIGVLRCHHAVRCLKSCQCKPILGEIDQLVSRQSFKNEQMGLPNHQGLCCLFIRSTIRGCHQTSDLGHRQGIVS